MSGTADIAKAAECCVVQCSMIHHLDIVNVGVLRDKEKGGTLFNLPCLPSKAGYTVLCGKSTRRQAHTDVQIARQQTIEVNFTHISHLSRCFPQLL